jgi:lactoylglutathione lyase
MKPAIRVIPVLIVERMDASVRFYRDVLGGAAIYAFPSDGLPSYVTLRIGTFEIALSDVTSSLPTNRSFRPAIGHRIQLCVNVDNVDDAIEALDAIGATVVMEPTNQPWGQRAAYVEDPDGNLVLVVGPVT